jgi:hypothetical protein
VLGLDLGTTLGVSKVYVDGGIVEVAAGVLGISVASVIVHDRNLSNAPVPLRTVAGRGRAAAKMTAVDAANLVIAVAGSESVKNSVWAVLTYGGLRGIKTRTTAIGVRSFDELPANHSLAEMLAALIDAVAVGELPADKFSLTVRLYGPLPHADLQLSAWNASRAGRTRH